MILIKAVKHEIKLIKQKDGAVRVSFEWNLEKEWKKGFDYLILC